MLMDVWRADAYYGLKNLVMKRNPKFIKEFAESAPRLAQLYDVVSVFCAGALAFHAYMDVDVLPVHYRWALMFGALSASVVFSRMDLYRSWRGRDLSQLISRTLTAHVFLGGFITVTIFFSGQSLAFSRVWVFLWIGIAAMSSITMRLIAYYVLAEMRKHGKNRHFVMLIGDRVSCKKVCDKLTASPELGFEVKQLILTDPYDVNDFGSLVCRSFPDDGIIDGDEKEIWICLPLSKEERILQIQESLIFATGNIRYLPDPDGFSLIHHNIFNIGELYLIDVNSTPIIGWHRHMKALFDSVLSVLILLLLSPLLLLISMGIKLSSPGPVLYRQERVGENGIPFMMLKFRTMPVNAESNGIQWGCANEKCTSTFGAFLRRTSLDEVPQLINVLKGEMSIVGPRPERPVFVEQFKHEIPGYMQKHMVKAGITGWAQVNGWRGDTDLSERIKHDLWYIRNWSPFLDIKILLLTILKGVAHKNAI